VDELKAPSKPVDISKWEVWEAYRQVKASQGAPGVDGCSIGDFEADLRGNLYKIWNRRSSGSYFPPRSRRWSYQSRMAAGPGCSGADRRGQDRPDGGGPQAGGEGRADLPPGLLRLPAGQVGPGRGGGMPAALLEDRLGDRP
jgi:hypothetical protein